MKKLLVFSLFLFLIGCTEDTLVETNLQPESPKVFTISVSQDYFEKSDFYTSSNYVFVTNKDGDILTDGILENGQITELVIEQTKSESFDLTIVSKEESSSLTNYNFTTYTSLNPSEIALKHEASESLETKIKVENTDGFLQMMLMGGMSQQFNSNDNIGSAEIRARVQSSYNNFYIPFKNALSDTYKYIWLEDVKNNLTQTVEYNEVPTPTMSRNLAFDDEITSRTIYGFKLGEYHVVDAASAPVQLPEDFVGPGYDIRNTNTGVFYYPENFFDDFKLHYCTFTDGKAYSAIQSLENESISLPAFNFQTINRNIDSFEVVAEGKYDIYKTHFNYSKKLGHTFNVNWTFYGQEKEVINVIFPKVVDTILLEKHADFELTNLENKHISLYKFEGLDSYREFVEQSHDFICNPKFQLARLERFEEVSESYWNFE